MIDDVGARLRSIRKKKKMTLTELAQQTGLSVGFLSNLERDLCSPTLEYVQRICAALDISLIKLLDNKNWSRQVIRAQEREVIFEQKDQIRYESVNFGSGRLDGLIIVVQPHCEYKKGWTHVYDEIGLVLEGELTITIEDEEFVLHPGDSFYIAAMSKHSLSNQSDKPCSSYWVKQITERHGGRDMMDSTQ
ncbi:MAG: helix-turn-helix domain-containing protein [Eubacteriales bacterium]